MSNSIIYTLFHQRAPQDFLGFSNVYCNLLGMILESFYMSSLCEIFCNLLWTYIACSLLQQKKIGD